MTAHTPGRGTKHELDDVVLWLKAGMLRGAAIFGVLALLAGWLGVIGRAGAAASIAKLVCFLCILAFIVLLTFWAVLRKDPSRR